MTSKIATFQLSPNGKLAPEKLAAISLNRKTGNYLSLVDSHLTKLLFIGGFESPAASSMGITLIFLEYKLINIINDQI